jgi:hypothetical protein
MWGYYVTDMVDVLYLDLLTSGEQVAEGNPSHTSHLNVVDHAHQLV